MDLHLNNNITFIISVKIASDPLQRPVAKAEEEENEVPHEFLCKVCFDKAIEVVYLPCAHAFACRECAFQLQRCAVCNSAAISFVLIHFSCAKCSPKLLKLDGN